MPWLLRGDEVLATLEVADSVASRLRGLLGRDGLEGAFLIKPAASVHTIGMKFPIDVAYCGKDLRVLDCLTMKPNRVGVFRPHARCVIEAEAGAFERWALKRGDVLEIRP
ncbi:MAG: DUF192 domain-containing protein [Acidimicrobiales bacterium]|nr:DUF192 domain-containing protein [Acidimicrobiales bacterium]